MLALVLTVALGQCTKDTDCKGDRVCSAGTCVDSAVQLMPRPSALAEADRIARVAQLKREVVELHAEIEDATLGGPIVKFLGGTVLGALSALGIGTWLDYRQCTAANFTGCSSFTDTGGALSIAGAAVAVALFVWGGLQLRLRLNARAEVPGEIASREAQLKVLEGR